MAVYPGPSPGPGEGPGEPIGDGGGGSTAPTSESTSGGGTATAIASRQSGGSTDVVGSIPGLQIPQGEAVLLRDGDVRFRFVMDRFEGLDLKRSAQEIGELQAVDLKNALTDEQTLRKRQASDNVSSSTTEACVGLHGVSGLREIILQDCDDETEWTESDAVNFTATNETTIKVEGTGSIQIDATGASANGDTLIHDMGAGGVQDLSAYDYVEFMLRGVKTSGNSIAVGVSEDNVTYTEETFSGTTTESWVAVRVDISALAASARNAIRYIRVTATNGGTAQIWYMDSIRAIRRFEHRLRMVRTVGTSTGGLREDDPGLVTLELDSDESGSWVTEGTFEDILATAKMRAVDWFGTTYITLGSGGNLKYEDGAVSAWDDAPPSHFIALHYEKLWLLSQAHDPHGLLHSTVNTATTFDFSETSPVGGDAGLFYVGRRYGYLPTGMKPVFGMLFIWTEGDLWLLTGSSNQTFDLQRAHPGAGTLSHESIVVSDNSVIWHDGLSDRVLMWRGGGVVDVGVPIRPTLQDIPAARKPWTAGVFDGRYYHLSYTRSGQTVNDRSVVFDTQLLRWHGPFEGNWVGFTSGYLGTDGSLYLGTEANGVRKYNDAVAGAEGSRDFAFKTGALNFRAPAWTKRIRTLGVKCEDTTATITANFYKDRSASAVRSYTLAFTGGEAEVQRTGVHDDVAADLLQLELTESSANAVNISEVILDGYYIRRQP